MEQRLKWEWKDSIRRYWYLTATTTGNVEPGNDNDLEWQYEIRDECRTRVYTGLLTGQSSSPPDLREFLQAWLNDITGIVLDGCQSE